MIHTNDGAIAFYSSLYYPLRYIDAEKPSFFAATSYGANPLTVEIDWINRGNGYTYFAWRGQHHRAFSDFDTSSVAEGDVVDVVVEYEVETWDDFSDQLAPSVVEVRSTLAEH